MRKIFGLAALILMVLLPLAYAEYTPQFNTSDVKDEVVDIGAAAIVQFLEVVTMLITIFMLIFAVHKVNQIIKMRGIK